METEVTEDEAKKYPEPPVRPKNKKLTHPWRGDQGDMFKSSRSHEKPDRMYPFKQGMTKLNRAR